MSKYDQKSIDKINNEISHKNWNKAVFLMGKYITLYPKDNYVRSLYVNILLKLGKGEMARRVLDDTVLREDDVTKTFASEYYATIKLLAQEERYQECLDYLYSHENSFKFKNDYYYIESFCKSRLGIKDNSNGYPGYIYQQIVGYSEERAKAYIAGEMEEYNQRKKGVFNKSFDIDACFQVVKSKIADSDKFYPGLVYFESVFKCLNCGNYMGRPTDLIMVNGLINSDNIINMLPGKNEHNIKVTDITEEVQRLSLK